MIVITRKLVELVVVHDSTDCVLRDNCMGRFTTPTHLSVVAYFVTGDAGSVLCRTVCPFVVPLAAAI